MNVLRTHLQIGVITLAGFLMYGLIFAQVNPDIIAPLLMLGFVLASLYDIRYLFIGWFVLAPYFEPLGVQGAANISSNITHNLFVPLAGAATLGLLFLKGRKLRIGWMAVFLLVFVGYAAISSYLATKGRYDDIRQLYLIYLLPFVLYLIIKNTTIDGTFLKMIAYASLFHVVVLAVLCGQEYFTGTVLYKTSSVWVDVGERRRIAGPFGSPIILGVFATTLLLYIYLAFKLELIPRYAYWVGSTLSVLLIFLTFTRSVWLGAFLTYMYILIRTGHDVARKLFRVVAFVALAFAGIATLIFVSPAIEQRLLGRENTNFRIIMAKASVDMFLDKPVVGWGAGTFDDYSDRYLFDAYGVYITKDTSHVTLLTILAELGIVGAIPLVMFIVLNLRQKGLPLRLLPHDDQLIVAVSVGAVITFVVNAFLIDMRFYGIAYCWFFVSLGFLQSVFRDHTDQQEEAPAGARVDDIHAFTREQVL